MKISLKIKRNALAELNELFTEYSTKISDNEIAWKNNVQRTIKTAFGNKPIRRKKSIKAAKILQGGNAEKSMYAPSHYRSLYVLRVIRGEHDIDLRIFPPKEQRNNSSEKCSGLREDHEK